jgi:hypothetical protein
VSDFIEQCRREWKRLNVPDPLAEEMAAELASDLNEAEAEGVSAEEFLGRSLSDPRSFAASWAGERGIVPDLPSRASARRRPFVLASFTSIAALGVIVTAVALLLGGEHGVALVPTQTNPPHFAPSAGGFVTPAQVGHGTTSGPVEWIVLFLAVVALGVATWLWSNRYRSRPATVPA